MASTSTSSVLLAVLFYLLCTTNGDDDMCKLRPNEHTEKCLDKLKEEFKCEEESAVSKCFKMCHEKKKDMGVSYYETYYKEMKSLDKVICDPKLKKDIDENRKCLETLFMDCKAVYGRDWTKKGDCDGGKPLLDDCVKKFLDKQTSEDCKPFANKLHDAFKAMCPSGNGATSTLGANHFAILVAITFAYFTAMQ